MNIKRTIKIGIDCAMTVLLPFLMAYSLIGEVLHEWLGVAMFVCLVAHHILNVHRSSIKNAYATVNLLFNVVLFVLLFLMMASGIVLSRNIFDFLSISSGYGLAREIHLPVAFWSYILMSFHLGLHWNMILGAILKLFRSEATHIRTALLRVLTILLSLYGVYAFIAREFPAYLFLQNHFVFYNYDEPLIFFFVDYFAIMILFAAMGDGTTRLIRLCSKK